MLIFNALQTTLSGGIGRYSYELSKNLYDLRRNDIKIIIREEDKELFSFVDNTDLIIYKGISSGKVRNYYEQFIIPKDIYRKYPNAILHYPDSMAPILAKNKVIITVHDIAFKTLKNVFTFKTKIWKNIITYLSVKKADKIIAISNFTKCELEKNYGKDISNKTYVVLNGFNNFSKEQLNIDNINTSILKLKEQPYLLTVSTISPRKNIDGLIKAYNNSKVKQNLKLVIAGANGWLYEDVFKLVDKLELNDRIVFTGKINDDELKFLYKNSQAFVYVSFYEGFGLPPLEAMSYEIPCIVSNTSSLPEVVGEAAIKVNPNSIDEIKEAIDYLMLNRNQYNRCVLLGKENVNKFSWRKCAKGSYEIIDKVGI